MSRKKKGTQSVIKAISVSVIGAGSSVALAGPTGGTVVSGGITIGAMNNNQMVITQALQKGIINWTDFSINAGELVQFAQQAGNDSVTLNRVLGSQVSNIQGALQANGNIFLINPNGIVFGANSQVDVAGLLATTFDVDDQSFLNGGDLNFTQVVGKDLASISNQGQITADDGGFVYLVAPKVDNSGYVIANVGRVTMAAGNRFTVNLQGSNLINFSVSADALGAATGGDLTGVSNSGSVSAQTVLLQGNAASGLMSSVVNNSGIVEATDLTMTGGDIVQDGTIKGVGVAAATTATLAATQTITTGSNSSTRASTLNLSVTGEGASIGTEEEALKVDADVLSATAENGHVLVTDVSGGVALLDVRAGTAQAGGSVVITAKGGSITSAHPSHINVTGYSANFIADGSVGTTNDALGTQVGVLSASTQDGGINLSNEGSVILGDIVAREQITVGGQTVSSTAVDNAGSIKLSNGDAGTKSVSVRSTGDVILTGTVLATDALSVRSNTGSILAAQAGTQLVGRTVNLQAGKEVGDVSQALSTQSNTVNAISQDGGIYLNESNGLTVGTISASGDDNDVVLNATAGNIAVGSITADGGSVSLTAAAGGITDNNGDATNVTAADLSLSSKNAIGTSGNALETNVDTLSATTSAAQAGVFLSNLKALTKLSVTTPNGDTNVAFSGGALIYNRNLSTLSLARTLGLDVAFSNTASGYKLGGIDAGADQSVSLYAAGDITQGSGSIVAKDLSIEASGNIGSADTALQTATDTLSLSTRNGFANLANTSGELVLSATANAANGAVKLSQTGDLIVDSVNATTGVELNAGGAITAAEDSLGTNISAGSLKLSGASIGTASQALTSQVKGGAVNLTANAGDVNFSNIGAISLLDVLASGKVSFQNSGDAVVGQVQAGGTVNFKVSGNVTDGNGDGANFVTSGLTAAVRSFGTSGDALEIQVDSLVIDAANGGIYARQSNGNLLSLVQLTSGGSGSDIQVSAGGDIALGHVDAGGNNVKLSAAGSIEDARSDKSKANIVARSLDISAPGGIGQQGGLDLDVSFLSAAGGTNGVTATNAGAVAVDSSSLVGKGASAINIVATAITVLDNNGGTITMDGGTLALTATAGNIVFLNQNDTIYLPGGGSITLTALSKSDSSVPGYDGVIIAGNLKTDGGNITLQAQSNITIGMLDALGNASVAGDVTVASAGGIILDGNGSAQNIRGNHVSLTANTPSEHDAELTRDTAIAEYSARDAEAAAKLLQLNILIQQLKDYEALVTSATLQNSLAELTQRLAEIAANQQSSKVDTMSGIADGLNTALNAATVVRNAAAVIAGAAQAIPFSGDAGADAAFAVVDLVMSAASLALDSYERYSLAPEQDKLTELNNTLDVANAAIYTAATNLATTTAIRDTTATSKAAADLAVFKANTARDAALQVRKQAVAAYDLNQMIDSSVDKPLGITANRLDINGGNAIDSSLYLNSTGNLGLGDITVASGEKIVADALNNIGVVGSVNSDTSISLKAGNAILGQGGTLITPDLLMVAGNGIGVNQAVNTQTDRVAADAGNAGVALVNANGGALLTIGTQGAVKGIRGAGDISVTTDGSLKVDQLVNDTTSSHTVSLTATDGSIIDGNNGDRNVQGGTLVAKAAGDIELDTKVDTLDVQVTDAGDITLREASDVTARNLTTADGDIDLNAAGAVVVGSLDAGAGTGRIDLTSGGAVDDDQDNSTLIVADALSIKAAGSVGATGSNANRHLDTQVNSVDVTASGEVNLAEVDDLTIGTLETDHGDVTVTTGGSLNLGTLTTDTVDSTVTLVSGGQITNAKDDDSSNIDAANLALYAASGIGADKALNVQVAKLEAHADTGSIKVEDLDGDLVIGGVTPNLGNAATEGVNTNAGDIQIGTVGDLTVNEYVYTGEGDVSLVATDGALTQNVQVYTGQGDVSLTAGTDLTQNAWVQSVKGDITVKAGGDLLMQGLAQAYINAGGNIDYSAGGNLSLLELYTSAGNIDLTAVAGGLTQYRAVQTGAGNITARAKGDLNTQSDTLVTGNGDIDYRSSEGDMSLQRVTTGSGDISLEATEGDLTQNSLVQTGAGDISSTAGDLLTVYGTTEVSGAGNIDLTAGGFLSQYGLVQTNTGDITAKAGGNLNMGAVETRVVNAGNIDYTAGGAASISDVSTGKGNITLTAQGGSLWQNGKVESGEGNITTRAHNVLVLQGETRTGKGNVTLSSETGGVIQNAQVYSGEGDISTSAGGNDLLLNAATQTEKGNITLTAAGNLVQNALVQSGAGDITAKAGADLLMTSGQQTAVLGAGNVSYTAGNDADLENLSTGSGDITLTAEAGDLTQQGLVYTGEGDITTRAGDSIVLNGETRTAKGNVALTAEAGDLTQNGLVYSGEGDITSTAGNDVALNATTHTVKGNVTLDAVRNLTQNALVQSGAGDITAKAGADLLMTSGQQTAVLGAGNVSYTAGNDADLENLSTGSGDITLTAEAGDLTQQGLVYTGEGDITTRAGDSIVLNGETRTAKGNVVLTAEAGDLTQNGLVYSGEGDITSTAGNDLVLNATTHTVKGDIVLNAARDLTQNAWVASDEGTVTAKAGRDLLMTFVGRTSATLGDVDYRAVGNATLQDISVGTGNVTLAADGDLLQNGRISVVEGQVGAEAGGDLSMAVGALTEVTGKGDVAYSAGGDVLIDQIRTANGNVALTAESGDIQVQGAAAYNVSAKQLTANAGGSVGSNDALRSDIDTLVANAGEGSIAINEADDITLKQVAAADAVNISAGDMAIDQLQGESISLDSTGKVETLANGLVQGGVLNVSAETGVNLHTAVDSATVAVNDTGNLTLAEDDDITLTRLTTADGDITVTAGGDIAVNTVDAGSHNVSLTSSNGAIVTAQQPVSLFARLFSRIASITGISGDRVELNAATGLGNDGAGSLQLTANTIDATTTSGNVDLSQSQSVNLEHVSTGNGDVQVAVNDGNAVIGEVSGTGAVNLSADNGQLLDDGDDSTVIEGQDLSLTASNGIGAGGALQTRAKTLDAKVTDSGNIAVDEADGLDSLTVNSAAGDVAITSASGDVSVGVINAQGHNVSLKAGAGAILDAQNDGVDDINANGVELVAAHGVGSNGNSFDVNVQTLGADGGTGGIRVNSTSTSPLVLSSTSGDALKASKGDIVLTSAGDLQVDGNVQHSGNGNISLSGANVAQNADITTHGSGNVTVNGRGTVDMAAGTTTSTSSGTVTYKGGQSVSVSSIQTSNKVGGGKVIFEAPKVIDNLPGMANVKAWEVTVNANNGSAGLIRELMGNINGSAHVNLDNRVIGGNLAESRRFMEALLQPAVQQQSRPEQMFAVGVINEAQLTPSRGFVEGEDGVMTYNK